MKDSLYGVPRVKKRKAEEISALNSLAFSSNLSALITASANAPRNNANSRSRIKKDDIFSKHNKNVKQRAQKDLEQNGHTTGEELDHDIWQKSRQKLQDKARLYGALKRGEIEDVDDKYGVDFDRKWAENEDNNEDDEDKDSEDDSDTEEELVEYIDEFGRTRKGTKAEASQQAPTASARPNRPSQVIYGDSIQTDAFNPDRDIAEQMATLAAKRDKAPTPPPDLHFDGKKEMRNKGVGFFHFSTDSDERKSQMEYLESERLQTEKRRAELAQLKKNRAQELEARRNMIAAKKGKLQADKFLDDLGELLADKTAPK